MQKKSPTASIIGHGHKLLVWFDRAKEDELYHLSNDPGEDNNILHENPRLAATLRKELLGWLESARHSYEMGDYPKHQQQGRFIETSP
jgi:hypothetical protein